MARPVSLAKPSSADDGPAPETEAGAEAGSKAETTAVAKRAATKAPAKKATKTPTKAPTKAPVKAPAKKAPVKRAPAAKVLAAAPLDDAAFSSPTEPAPLGDTRSVETLPAPESVERSVPATTRVEPGVRPAGLGLIATLALLMLAAAVGLGAAALVKNRDATWEARGSVALLAGPDVNDPEGAQALGRQTYAEAVANPSFTAQAAFKAMLPTDEVRETRHHLVVRRRHGPDPHRAGLHRGRRQGAGEQRGRDAGRHRLQPGDAHAAEIGRRLTPSAVGPVRDVTRTTPSTRDLLLVGLLSGAAVLVLGLVLGVCGGAPAGPEGSPRSFPRERARIA